MIEIAILGYGTVGSGVAEVIDMNAAAIRRRTGQDIHVKRILDVRDFPGDPYADRLTKDADDVFGDPEIRVVVETIGGKSALPEIELGDPELPSGEGRIVEGIEFPGGE